MHNSSAPPIEIQASRKHRLGMPAARFLRDYWQKRPLLIRSAFPDLVSPVSPEDLAGLACEQSALSRIVTHQPRGDRWTLRHGPFAEADFTSMGPRDWTLLVQDVDKWDADVRALLDAFDFIPRWRIDDVMISYAAPGGSVGAHVDQYDVFLLQGLGARRWQVDASPNPPTAFRDDVELKLLREFHPTHSWTLEPGDMLYLPPGVPHHGVAADACLTYSIGMRAPSQAELLTDFADHLAQGIGEEARYVDPGLALPMDPFEIDAAALTRVRHALAALQADDASLAAWFGGFISGYRSVGIAAPPRPPTEAAVRKALAAGGSLARHPFVRTAWARQGERALLFVGGAAFEMSPTSARALAAATTLDAGQFEALVEPAQAIVIALARSGSYIVRKPVRHPRKARQ
ncbi:MAG: cupin domain-containing protein [Proteobacteria bacterium]|nr:cupin domain-containing protein [Pseudomonadota bacterium]MBS0462812.1 cupin domain-containing protein [Pseudomonadota bacterium]MBS0464564.1 cupin domain-containing protein [Pseudomonadota bacterium]